MISLENIQMLVTGGAGFVGSQLIRDLVKIRNIENIIVIDNQNYKLLNFDRNGQFQWKAGRKGQGPGEIEYTLDIKATDDGGIIVVDQGGKLHYFDKDGNLQNMTRLEKVINTIISWSKEKIFSNLWIRGQPGNAEAFFS